MNWNNLLVLVTLLCTSTGIMGFQAMPTAPSSPATVRTNGSRLTLPRAATTMEPPTKERTERKTGGGTSRRYDEDNIEDDNNDDDDYGDLEYLIDSSESREMEDPFHILLLGSTFEKPKVTISYVASTVEYVVSMPRTEAVELSKFAKDQGMSCLGTWPREECLSLGKQLQRRDLVCRVVPYCEGGQRGWQAKDMNNAGSAGSSSGAGFD